jgi:hypothetical protein
MKLHVRPSRASSIIGILVGVAFLVFGVVFLVVLVGKDSQIGVGFMSLWIFVVCLIIAFNVYHLISRKGMLEIDAEAGDSGAGAEANFDVKLRRLERLRSDRLISEEEYKRKRAEILDQKW